MAARVINARPERPRPDAVYIGRPSIWGNPFTHLKGETEMLGVYPHVILEI